MKIASRVKSIALATALATVLATTLSGCFVIPMLDGRSPFDDPFGVSTKQLREAIPELQAALDNVDTGDDWVLHAGPASENCEGSCNLHLLASITPSESFFADEIDRSLEQEKFENDDELFAPQTPRPGEIADIEVVVPDEVWRAATRAAIEAAEKLGINVTVEGGYAASITVSESEYFASVNECPAVEAGLGSFDQNGNIVDPKNRFTARSIGDLTSCSVEFNTSKFSGLGVELGL